MSSSTEASDFCVIGQHECCEGDWFETIQARPNKHPEIALIGLPIRCGCPCHAADRVMREDGKRLMAFALTYGAELARFATRDPRVLDENVRHAISAAWIAGQRSERERMRT